MVLLAWLLSVVAAQGQESTKANLPTLTHVEQIREMTIEEAGRGYPVRIRGVVTYYNWDAGDLFIQDSTAGIWVNPGQTKLALHHGEFVQVEGFSGVGDFAPEIEPAHFRSLGEAPMPKPRRPTSDELTSGRQDSQWIELQGVVRSVAEREGGLVLNLSSGAFECSVFVLKYPSLPTGIVDGQVRIRGVFGGLYDPSSVRFIGFQVLTPSWADVKVLERPTQGLWSVPVRPMRLFLRLTPEGAFTHRVHVRGVVTLQQLGRVLCIRDSGGALLVNTTQPTPLKVGDLIDAMGYPAIGDYTVIMRDAIFQRVGAGPAPEPVAVNPEKMQAGSHNADLVRLSARLLNCTTRPGEEVLELQAGRANFRAVLNTGTNSSPLGSLRAGSLLQLTGVVIVEADKNHEPKGFEILLRSPADVVVLELPSWWTAGRIARLLIILAGIVFWISLWVAVLRRRVEERTETIRAALESTVDGILVVNSAGKIVAYNHKFAEMWCIPESVLASRDDNVVLNFVLSQLEDPDALLRRVRQTYADHDTQTDDVIEFKDGRVFERHSEPQRVKGKNVGRVWGFRNVTERKRAEDALRQSEQSNREVIASARDGVIVYDREFRYQVWNRFMEELTGVPASQVLGRQGFDLFPHLREQKVDALLQRALEGEEVHSPDMPFRVPLTGKSGCVSSIFNPHFGPNGEIIGVISIVRNITERKRAEAALIEERHLLHTLMDNLPDMIYFKDRESRFTRINNAHAKAFGLEDPAQAVGKTDFDFYTPEHAKEFHRDEEEIIRTGQPVVGKEEKESWPDGRETWASTTKMPLRDAQGQIVGTFGISRDITKRKDAEEELRRSEAKYRSTVLNIPEVVWTVTSEGRFVFITPNIERLSGYTAEEVHQYGLRLFFESIHPDDQPRVKEASAALFRKGQPYNVECRARRKNGEWIWVHDRAVGTFERDGVRYANGLLSDITERKRAEEALRESEEHFRRFIENVPLGVYRTTPDGRVLMANPALLRTLGYDSWQELASRNLESEGFEAGRPRSAFREQIEREGEVGGLEAAWKRRDGSVVFVRESARAFRADDGRVLYYDGVVEDVTERRRLEEQLRQAQKMEAVGRLAGGVAHDFNNLLTIVIGYSDLLLKKLTASDGIRPCLEEIKKAGERAALLTRQLLAFSRKQVLQPQILDLNSLLTNVDEMLRRVIGEDIELVTRLPSGLGRVKADPGQIEQVIMNLAVNARDAMPQGGQLTLEAANAELDSSYVSSHGSVLPGHYVMIAMSDTGIGMDAGTQAHIFEPFFTTKEQGKGTGLGLATVHGIVKQSGGSIWVYSEPGKGTTFKVYLPRIDQAVEVVAPTQVPVDELSLGCETILLVEDEGAVCSLVRGVLESRGYQVLETNRANEALEIGERHKERIHLLLTDVVMPQMNGMELAEHLALIHPETKILYMSGYTDDAVVRNGLLGPGTVLLQKPFTADALACKLREVLDGVGALKT
jgi:PAS domain S-box-containing protein